MPSNDPRLFPGRFVLEWAIRETEELGELLRSRPDPDRLRLLATPVALGAITNYRMALEHVAQDVARAACPDARPERVSFPVAIDPYAFRSMMVTRFPGLRVNQPSLYGLFRTAQGYRPGSDRWLPVLHGLWNRTIPIEVRSEGGAGDGRASGGPAEAAGEATDTLFAGELEPLEDLLRRIGARETDLVDRFDEALRRMPVDPERGDRRPKR